MLADLNLRWAHINEGTLSDKRLNLLWVIFKGIPNSHCYGSVLQGIFQGSIHLPDETFYVEKSKRFFNGDPTFHSVIYRESDINMDPFKKRRLRERREVKDLGSKGNDKVTESMTDVINSNKKTQTKKIKTVRIYILSETIRRLHLLQTSRP